MEQKKNVFATVKDKWNHFAEKTAPGREKAGTACKKTGHVLGQIGLWMYRLRSILISIPVGVAAVILALRNLRELPEMVALTVPKVQEGALVMAEMMLSRGAAVLVPLAITGVCILMVFLSRRVTYPALIGAFSLVLPIALNVMNCVLG